MIFEHSNSEFIKNLNHSVEPVEIKDENFQVLHQRISLPPMRKLWLAAKTWIKG